MTGIFGYYSDKRRTVIDLKNQYRAKKVEIGESYYYINGETMAVLRKTISFWQRRNNQRGELSLESMAREIKKLDAYFAKLKEENWKYNLINLYFDVNLTDDQIIESNARSQLLYLKVLDIGDKIKKAPENDREALYQQYAVAIFDMCSHYEEFYKRIQEDMRLVKQELLHEFKN